jgi:hypothetical protein
MTVEEIVEEFLQENGYDGLTDDDECTCFLDDGFMKIGMTFCPGRDCRAIHRKASGEKVAP